MSHCRVLICGDILHLIRHFFLCSTPTTESTGTKCKCRHAGMNLTVSCNIYCSSLAKKYPTAVINPGCAYRGLFYYSYVFLWRGSFEQTFFYVRVEWMLASGSLLFYLVCLEKGEGRADCSSSAFGPECVYSFDYALNLLTTKQMFFGGGYLCCCYSGKQNNVVFTLREIVLVFISNLKQFKHCIKGQPTEIIAHIYKHIFRCEPCEITD